MTKKRKIVLLSLVGAVIAVLLAVALVLGALYSQGYTITIGGFMQAENGTAFLFDDSSPIILNGQRTPLGTPKTGDRVLVLHGPTEEIYPARTDALLCIPLSSGPVSALPTDTLRTLDTLGFTLPADGEVHQNFSAKYIHSFSRFEGVEEYPAVRVIRSYEELMAHYQTLYTPENSEFRIDHNSELLTAFNGYEDYFQDRVLLMILQENGSGSIRHKVQSVTQSGKLLNVRIDELVPYGCTCDMAYWHILVELPVGVTVESEQHVIVHSTRRQTYNNETLCHVPLADRTPAFSYAEDLSQYDAILADRSRYKNKTEAPTADRETAVARALNECTVEYKRTEVHFDDTVGMWRVCFLPGRNVLGGDQTVYLDTNGITHLIFYGE